MMVVRDVKLVQYMLSNVFDGFALGMTVVVVFFHGG